MKLFSAKRLISRLLVVFVYFLGLLPVWGAPGDLDTTFSLDGKTLTNIGKGRDEAKDAVLQPDGKIVVVGESGGNQLHISLARYNADGSLDASFGTGGKVIAAFPGVTYGTEVGLQSDGKIVVAGYRYPSVNQTSTKIPIVARFNANGSIDTGFGTNGLRDLSFSVPSDMVIQPDNKMLITGISETSLPRFQVLRLNADGTPDSSFGIDGIATASINNGLSVVYGVALQADGKVVLAGYGHNGADYDFALARFDTSGILDTTFDGDGRLMFPMGAGNDTANAVKIQPDGKIVVAGSVQVSSPSLTDFGVARLNTDGSFDTSFNGTGKIVVPVGSTSDDAYDLGFQTDGKIVVGGNSFLDFSVIRLTTGGTLDTNFGTGGKVILPNTGATNTLFGGLVIQPDDRIFVAGFVQDESLQADYGIFQLSSSGTVLLAKREEFNAGDDFGRDVAIQADGKIVVAGSTSTVGGEDFALARYNADGTLDTSFGAGGKAIVAEIGFQAANCLAIQPDGKIVAAGYAPSSAPFRSLAVYRFNADGSLDTGFNGSGKYILSVYDQSVANDVLVQPDGKIVVAMNANFGMGVLRLNADGTVDNSFNGNGRRIFFPSGPFSTYNGNAVALQADGKIVIGGSDTSTTQGLWQRLNADGSIDDTNPNLLGAPILIEDAAIQADGKIVFAGYYRPSGGTNNISVARFNANKTLDTNFGNSGFNYANFGIESIGKGVVIQTGGQIVVGGFIDAASDDFALARFKPNGFLDTGFGNGGKVVTPMTVYDDRINGIALQADGNIVAAGHAFNGIDFDYAVARYDGSASPTAPARTLYDFDGDGRADVSVFRPSENKWYILKSSTLQIVQTIFAVAGDVPVPADYDGDGKTDVAIWRPSSGDWWYLSSINGAQINVHWGQSGDIPRPSDFDGDGKTDYIVYRPSNSAWYRLGSTGATSILAFGIAEDKPLIGDFDGDGKSDVAIFRPSTGDWWYASSISGQFLAVHWGASGDVPAPADYDGDGKTDFAVFRPSEGGWYIRNSASGSATTLTFGLSGDKPIPADYDGDGKADIAVFRPSNGTWYLLQSTSGFGAVQFGVATDIPTENAFIP